MKTLTQVACLITLIALMSLIWGCGGTGTPSAPAMDTMAKPPQPAPPSVPAGKLVGSKVVQKSANTWGVFTMDTDGTDPVQLNVAGSATSYCWSHPKADRIALRSTIGDLCTVPRAGGTPSVFVADNEPGLPAGSASQAVWSPDGSRIAFKRYWVEGGYNRHAIGVKDWPTGTPRLITTGPTGYRDEFPAWSPDSQYVVFERYATNAARLMVVAADGNSEPSYVSTDVSVRGTSDWAVDAATGDNWIVYAASGVFARLQADATGHTTGAPITLPNGGASSAYLYPCWSPDGQWVAFSNETVSKTGAITYATYVLQVAGGTPYKVGDLAQVDWAGQ